jgi:CheY-like chemotaxis protein
VATLNSSKAAFDVLVVDDTALNRHLLVAMLGKMGCSVRVAEDGPSALQAFSEHRPDMVLMDVQMPGINGFEVVRAMRTATSEWFPIIFISANTSNEHVVQGLDSGGDDYLFKPIHFNVDIKHSRGEIRFHALGKTDEGRSLHITFTLRNEGEKIRVISARDMHKKERVIYEQAN